VSGCLYTALHSKQDAHTVLPQVESVKYLGLHFDRRLNWKVHISKKRKQTDLKAKETNWLIGRKSNLSLENKLLVYKAIIKPIWIYTIELWGCASKSNTAIMQRKKKQSHYRPGVAQMVSRKLRLPDFMTTAQDSGKVVSLTHRPPLPPRKYTWYSFLLETESTPGP
jgi:hypothetical protein